MNYVNWSYSKVGEEWVPTGYRGAHVWGLKKVFLTWDAAARLIRLGAVHYQAMAVVKRTGLDRMELWICDGCQDELQEAEGTLMYAEYQMLRTTSEVQAKRLCMACEAEWRGIPELMMHCSDDESLTYEERAMIAAAHDSAYCLDGGYGLFGEKY